MEATFRQAQTSWIKVPPVRPMGRNFTADEMNLIKNGTLFMLKQTTEMKDGINVMGG